MRSLEFVLVASEFVEATLAVNGSDGTHVPPESFLPESADGGGEESPFSGITNSDGKFGGILRELFCANVDTAANRHKAIKLR